MDFNKLIARVKAILLTPKAEWPVIAEEPANTRDLYRNYIVILAAIPAIFTFVKTSLIGVNVPLAGVIRVGIAAGLASAILGYVLSLVMVYVMAMVVDALAPSFGGQKNQIQALKTMTYAYTASWVAGLGQIVPALGLPIMIAGGIYSIYLVYLALPSTMKCPPDRAVSYTAVAMIIGIVLSMVVGAVVAAMSGTGAYAYMHGVNN